MKKSILLLKEITKDKAGNKALDHFFMEILSGEIINLIGLEGSGKEEIYSILFGDEIADSGEIWFMGRKYEKGMQLPVEQSSGIFFIGNYNLIIPNLSIAENLYIVEKMKYLQISVSRKKMELQAKKMFDKFNIYLSPEKKAKDLSVYECCILRLMRAYVKRAKLIVIDDILNDYTFEKAHQIIEILERFKQEGISILWLNSYPDAITEISDKVSVISQGRNSMIFYKDEYNKQNILKRLAGNDYSNEHSEKKCIAGKKSFIAKNLQSEYFNGLSFHCSQGEILGIYDLKNKFSVELRKLLLGRRNYTGTMIIDGHYYKADSEFNLIKNRIAIIDGKQYQSLIFPELSVRENIEMPVYKKTAMYGIFINQRMKKHLDKIGLDICRKSRIHEQMNEISRRDAMQIVYHRWLLTNPKILFCFQPFLRLDVVSRRQLEKLLADFKNRGTGIVLCSSDLTYLQPICDRIITIENDMVISEVERDSFS